uniref:Salivary secreted peptide n=1 Tax=Bactrocera dorsalis TaxID=27457 RepID=A0A034WMQ1_BACDO
MKIIVQVCVLLAIAAVAYSASSTWGVRSVNDTIIVNKRVAYPAVRNAVQTIYFDVPESNQSNSKVISAIYLRDQFQNSSGPTNTLLYGGPGWTYASVQMKTQTGLGLNVTYVVYAN